MKMDTAKFDLAARHVLAVLPSCFHEMERLRALAQQGAQPTVTVVGKYNHGKSRLLNELIAKDVFAVADKRETVALAEHVWLGVRWLDAPGLDADVGLADDGHAHQAAWLQADIRLFVHAAKEGELDAAERALLQKLYADQQRTRRRTVFVLGQVDQMADEAHLHKVINAIQMQVPELVLYPVSSTRYRQGVDGGKKLLLEKSGIPALQAMLRDALAEVPQARSHETALLLGEIRQALELLKTEGEERLHALLHDQRWQRQDFDQGLVAVLDKVQSDLQPVLELNSTDQALVPDSFETMFKPTAGKQERARLQIAYSYACIVINFHLIKHGVVGLPLNQQTSVRSLDTVMVAVMGVSVKYRNDLRQIFCEAAGRDRLKQAFAHYYELSEDRMLLARQIAESTSSLSDVEEALAAMRTLENI